MSHGKQITLFTHATGANGWKVAFVLEELGLTYEPTYLDFGKGEHKAPEYTKYNPNGRIPAIIDHGNGNFVLWESDAILQYLVDKYDTEHRISVVGDEKYKQLQWLYFQASGQGPYYGQAAWFDRFHSEKIPSAVERYRNEIKRVLGVLESVLSKQDWLVGGKLTIADISFITWNEAIANFLFENYDWAQDYPATSAWHKRLLELPSVKKCYAERTAIITKSH